jgi:hypothetical protein
MFQGAAAAIGISALLPLPRLQATSGGKKMCEMSYKRWKSLSVPPPPSASTNANKSRRLPFSKISTA